MEGRVTQSYERSLGIVQSQDEHFTQENVHGSLKGQAENATSWLIMHRNFILFARATMSKHTEKGMEPAAFSDIIY